MRAQTISDAWFVEVSDTDGTLIGNFTDANNRMEAMYRLVELRVSIDGAAMSTVQFGRIIGMHRRQDTSTWRISITDERILERRYEVYTQLGDASYALGSGSAGDYAGTVLWPGGPDGSYGGFTYGQGFDATATSTGNIVFIRISRVQGLLFPRPNGAAVELIRSDLKPQPTFSTSTTTGNFETLRANVNGTERHVFAFRASAPTYETQLLEDLETPEQAYFTVAVVWSGYASQAITSLELVMPDHEPTTQAPLHVGGTVTYGQTIGQLAKDIMDEISERYDSTAVTNWINDTFLPYVRYRKTAPQTAEEALRQLYLTAMYMPFINSDGEIAPKSIRLPQNVTAASLFEFTKTNSVLPQPTFQHDARDQVTRLRITYPHERQPTLTLIGSLTWRTVSIVSPTVDTLPLDLIISQDVTLTRDHDKQSDFGIHELELRLDGLHSSNEQLATLGLGTRQSASVWGNILAAEMFRRFGDGPIRTELHGDLTTDLSTTEPGEFVVVDIDSYPNAQSGSLGGDRIMQVLSKERHPEKIIYSLLDAGGDTQILTTPSVSTAANATNPREYIDVTISGLDTGAGYILRYQSSGGTWKPAAEGPGNETITVGPLASGTTWNFAAMAVREGRISSDWSSTASRATTALTAPSGVTEGTDTGVAVALSWTNGESNYEVELLLDESTCAGASRERVVVLPAGTTDYTVSNLSVSTTYCAGVRHIDQQGGTSSEATLQFDTAASGTQAPTPLGMTLLQGSACP